MIFGGTLCVGIFFLSYHSDHEKVIGNLKESFL